MWVVGATLFALVLPAGFLGAPTPAYALDIGGLGGVAAQCLTTSLLQGFLGGIGGALGGIVSGGAKVPVLDSSNLAQNKITQANTSYPKQKEGVWDCLAWGAAKVIIAELGASVIEWIDQGFEGNPSFIDDPSGFFLDIADREAAAFIFQNDLGFLCDPLKLPGIGGLSLDVQIRRGLFNKYFGGGPYGRGRLACNLTSIVENLSNAPAFLSGDPQAGAAAGWDDWFTITQVPTNNMYGAMQAAQVQMHERVSGSQAFNQMVADWNSGFKSVTNEIGEQILPGDFIKNEFTEMFGSDRRALDVADELNEIIAGIFSALLNQGLTQGLSSFASGTGGQTSFSSRMRDFANNPDLATVDNSAINQIFDQTAQQWNSQSQTTESNLAGALAAAGLASGHYAPVQTQEIAVPEGDLSQKNPASIGNIQTASAAMDGSQYTSSRSSCGNCNDTYTLSNWFNIRFPNTAARIDEIQLTARDVNRGPWYAIFTDENNINYRVDFVAPDGTRNFANSSSYNLVVPENYTYTPNTTTTGINAKPATTHFGQAIATASSPANLRLIPMKNVQLFGQITALQITEMTLYRHLLPEVDAYGFITSLDADATTGKADVNPRTDT